MFICFRLGKVWNFASYVFALANESQMLMSFACLSFQICAKLLIWRGTFLYKLLKLNEILHDKDLIWSTGMALRMKIRSFVHNYFVMTLKVASLNSFFSKPLILWFYFVVVVDVVESELFWRIFFKRLHRWGCQCQISAIEAGFFLQYLISLYFVLHQKWEKMINVKH